MSNNLVDFIHVGDYKTATTYLQEVIFPFHPEINYLGDHLQNKELEKVLRAIVDCRDLDFNAQDYKKIIDKNILKSDKITGLSREALSQSNYISGENAQRNAQRIKAVFGNVKILYVIREPFSMLESLYSQYIKIGGTRSFQDWFLDPMETKNIVQRLKYYKNIQMYYDIFGKENVKVLIFEQLKTNNQLFLKNIFAFIGCNDVAFVPKVNKSVNLKLTTYGMVVSRFLNTFIRTEKHCFKSAFVSLDKIIYTLLPKQIISRIEKNSEYILLNTYHDFDKKQRVLYIINMKLVLIIEKLSEKIKIGKKFKIDKKYQDFLNKELAQSNHILKKQYGLDIDNYGWYLN